MNLGWIRPLAIRGRQWLVRNAPHLLMGMGTTSSIAAVIFAAKSSPAANQAITDAREAKGEALTPWETVKAVTPYYIPAAGMELFSLMCFWSAHGINLKRQALLVSLYSTAEQTLVEYQRKVVDMIGEKPEKEIRNAIAQDHIDRDPPPAMLYAPDSDCWCYYNRYKFRNNYLRLKDIQNEANAEMIRNLYLSESDLLWMFDPDRRYIIPDHDSHHVGWTCDNLMEFDILPTMTPNHEPALEVHIRDKDGREYLPQPGYSASL